jgi:hypothetical protein
MKGDLFWPRPLVVDYSAIQRQLVAVIYVTKCRPHSPNRCNLDLPKLWLDSGPILLPYFQTACLVLLWPVIHMLPRMSRPLRSGR